METILTDASVGDCNVPALFTERYRPQLHYSAPRNWLNDPNGLVWSDGVYHLFYQHNPFGNDWGNMHWGHAISSDLVHWQNRPVALYPDHWGTGFAFSGCVVVDHQNRSGLSPDRTAPLVALYTGAAIDGLQTQCLAFSTDGGDSWEPYFDNPVIANPGTHDFRDPKVIWNAERAEWVMAIAVGVKIDLYVSSDLLAWQRVSEFRCQLEDNGDVVECPDLFPLRSPTGERHWVLIVSATNAVTHKDRSTRYYIGSFDGRKFEAYDQPARWIDYGPDNYASVTWDNVPNEDGRRIAIGWMSNWRYAREAPTYPWRGHMTFPRELSLLASDEGFQLAARPVIEVDKLCAESVSVVHEQIDGESTKALFSKLPAELLDLDLLFDWEDPEPRPFGLEFSNETGDLARIVFDPATDSVIVDRTQVGNRTSRRHGADRFAAPLETVNRCLDLRIIKDRASIEVFSAGGTAVFAANLFFDRPFESVSLFGDSNVKVHGQVSVLNSMWAGTAG